MEKIVNIHIEKLPEGFYLATSDDIQGLVAQGRTVSETLEIARDVARKLMEEKKTIAPGAQDISDQFDYPLIVNAWWEDLQDLRIEKSLRNLRNLASIFFVRQLEVMKFGIIPRQIVLPPYLIIRVGDMPEGTLRAILKQAGIDTDVFLKKWNVVNILPVVPVT